jgi:molybdopterin molybdotransferase
MVEETERTDDGNVRVFTPVYPGQHVGRRGADIATGQPVLPQGAVLNPSRIGVLAAIGALEVDVYDKPRVSLLSTGNEIVEPGRPLAPGRSTTSTATLSSIARPRG